MPTPLRDDPLDMHNYARGSEGLGNRNCNNQHIVQYPATSPANITATKLTSNMIKSSLSDIKSRLDEMRRNKESIEQNVLEYEKKLME
jgi:hypothetical protein